MENLNCKELRQIAKERKIKYYYKMRREGLLNELIQQQIGRAIGEESRDRPIPAPRPVVQRLIPAPRPTGRDRLIPVPIFNRLANSLPASSQSSLDKPIPDVSTAILIPTTRRYVPLPPPQIQKSTNNNSIVDWIMSGIDLIKNAPKKVINYGIEAYDSFKSKVLDLYKHKPIEFKLAESALDSGTRTYTATNDSSHASDESSFMKSAKRSAIKTLNENRNAKVYMTLSCVMERTVMLTGDTIVDIAHFSTKAERVLESTDLDELYERSKEKILEKISTFQQLGSNWRFVSVEKMEM